MLGDDLFHPTARDLSGVIYQLEHISASAAGAGLAVGVNVFQVPVDRALVLQSIAAKATGVAGVGIPRGIHFSIVANNLDYVIGYAGFSGFLSADVDAPVAGQVIGPILVEPGALVRATAFFNVSNVGNGILAFMNGYTIPRGNTSVA